MNLHTENVLCHVYDERRRQDEKFPNQWDTPDGTGLGPLDRCEADRYRKHCDYQFSHGVGTFRDILAEEVYEAFAESDPIKLREELVQVAAVAVKWVEAIDRRGQRAETA